MNLDFVKMHGIGNDFILMDFLTKKFPEELNPFEMAKRLCHRHFGIGADGLILILPSKKHDLKMRILNNDGSEAQMCGNGIRCFARYAYENQFVKKKKFSVETLSGEIIPEIIFKNTLSCDIDGVRVDMGKPRLSRQEIPMKGDPNMQVINEEILLRDNQRFQVTCVSMGNPHCVLFIPDSLGSYPVDQIGPAIENQPIFPEKTNVEFIQIINDREINFRVWERGVGETLACGTGASAAVVAGVLNQRLKKDVIVHLQGGDLRIEWREDGHIYMTGPAETTFHGTVQISA